jgi:arylsulfatase A-like enzyme
LRALPPYQAIDDEREPAFYRARYNGEVRYADAAIGELLRGADASADRDRLVIAFTADHGEALGEGGMWFAHASALVDPLVRVPLLLAIPGRAPERRSDTASLVDLVPTLLAALGVEPPGELPGRDLLAPGAASAERPAYFHALEPIPGQWIEHWGAARGDARFYRIDKQGRRSDHARRAGADVSPDAAEIAALRGGAESLRAEIRARAIPAAARAAHPPSASERERLEALGYLDPAAD